MNAVQSRRLTQEVDDTYRLSLIGGVFYLAGWLVVGAYGGAFVRAPTASLLLVLAFVLASIARVWHRPPADPESPRRLAWLHWHCGIVIATGAVWGGLFCWVMLDPAFARAQPAALLSTLGLATAVAHVFNLRRRPAYVALAVLYLPGFIALWSLPQHRASALVMTIYLIYVIVALFRGHAEYQRRLDLDQDLRDQRDLFARQSLIDPLTELANRRHFADVLAAAFATSARDATPLTLLLLDLDEFKKVNDTHGHAIGDACLTAFAQRLKAAFGGPGELVARLGGEEFGVVLGGLRLAGACQRAQDFRDSLVDRPLVIDAMLLGMTASIGIAELHPERHRDPDDLYRAADSAVYRAKAEGRNRVCSEPVPVPLAAYQAG